jgi:hypothetical protein
LFWPSNRELDPDIGGLTAWAGGWVPGRGIALVDGICFGGMIKELESFPVDGSQTTAKSSIRAGRIDS